MNIKLAYLESFIEVAKSGSISKAASHLGVTQPALSRQLKLLEEGLGRVLFARGARGVALTDEGKRFWSTLDPALRSLLEIIDDGSGEQIAGDIAIGTLEGIAHTWLVEPLSGLLRAQPQMQVRVEIAQENVIHSRLVEGWLDFGIVTALKPELAYDSAHLAKERAVLVAREGLRQDLEDLAQFERARFVGYRTDDPLLAAYAKTHFASTKLRPEQIVLTVNSLAAMVEATAKLDAYAFMPWHAVSRAVDSGRLRIASSKVLEGDLFLVRMRDRPLRKRHRAFREHILTTTGAAKI